MVLGRLLIATLQEMGMISVLNLLLTPVACDWTGQMLQRRFGGVNADWRGRNLYFPDDKCLAPKNTVHIVLGSITALLQCLLGILAIMRRFNPNVASKRILGFFSAGGAFRRVLAKALLAIVFALTPGWKPEDSVRRSRHFPLSWGLVEVFVGPGASSGPGAVDKGQRGSRDSWGVLASAAARFIQGDRDCLLNPPFAPPLHCQVVLLLAVYVFLWWQCTRRPLCNHTIPQVTYAATSSFFLYATCILTLSLLFQTVGGGLPLPWAALDSSVCRALVGSCWADRNELPPGEALH